MRSQPDTVSDESTTTMGEAGAEPTATPPPAEEKRPRGFAGMDPQAVRALARKGGSVAHQRGTAHRFTAEEAREAGRKGGRAPHKSRGRLRAGAPIETTETNPPAPSA
jgi:general stress protein YciG